MGKHNESFKKLEGNSGVAGDKSGNGCPSQTVDILNDRLSNSEFFKSQPAAIDAFQGGEW